jgi:hypothetical protein
VIPGRRRLTRPRGRPIGALFLGIAVTRLGEQLTIVALIWLVF